MNLTQKFLLLICFFLSWELSQSFSQVIQTETGVPVFVDSGKVIENRIILDLPLVQFATLRSTTGEKCEIRPGRVVVNEDTLKQMEISTRGQTTLMFQRKSLSFKLKSKARFRHGERKESLRKFYLLNLSMDKYYCRNRLAFEMMEILDIFDLFYSFGELEINGLSEGVFMIIEPPEEWALKEADSPVVIRRGYDHSISKMKSHKKTDRAEVRTYSNDYKEMYKCLKSFEGEELYEALLEYIDLDFYMKWLAFNFLVHNGDYSDEVFFYLDPDTGKFRIIPWDYDDIFAVTPHEGLKQRNRVIGNRLLFSSEDLLDIKIATDPFLYQIYLERLKEVLSILSDDTIRKVIEHTYAELVPYYADDTVIANVQFDYFKDASLENLRIYLYDVYRLLTGLRKSYLKQLAE